MYGLFVPCIVFFVWILSREAVSQSTSDADPFNRDCKYSTQCAGRFEFSDCKNNKCECRNGFYFAPTANPSGLTCLICPNFGERCDATNCCRHSEYVGCIDGVCRCRDSSMDSCLHFEPNTELMIAAKLALFGIILVSLAILLMVLRRSCGGEDYYDSPRSTYRRDRIYASLNSIQRFVLAKMQDRPPPYDELEPSSKPPPYSATLSTQDCYPYEAPPPYSVSIFPQASSSSDYPGVSNPVFTDTGPDAIYASIFPITLPSSAPGRSPSDTSEPHQKPVAGNQSLSDLTRPVLTNAAARRMSNYYTFTTQTEPENTPTVTSALSLDDSSSPSSRNTSQAQTDTSVQQSSSFRKVSFSENVPCSSSRHNFGPNRVPISCPSYDSSEGTVVDWSGNEIKTDLPSSSGWRSSEGNHAVHTTDLPGSSGWRSSEGNHAVHTTDLSGSSGWRSSEGNHAVHTTDLSGSSGWRSSEGNHAVHTTDFSGSSGWRSSEGNHAVHTTDLSGSSSWRSSEGNHAVHTTDLPFHDPGTSDDWLSTTLGSVVHQQGPPGNRRLSSEEVKADQSKLRKNLGSLATFFISERRSSQNSIVSDCSEPESMSLARDYYTYDYDDDVCCLMSHLYPAGQVPPEPQPRHSADTDVAEKS